MTTRGASRGSGAPPAPFGGFGDDAVEFYDGLVADNSRAYWDDHREVYQRDVHAPMTALLAATAAEFGAGKIFRPYRDLRFTTDTTPYKTHCGAVAGPFYVEVGPDGLLAAAGYHTLASDQLARYRAAVDDDRRGDDLLARLATAETAGLTVGGAQLRTRPRGTSADHPRLDLLRRTGLVVWRRWAPDDVLHGPGTLRRVRTAWRAARPVADWLDTHVGPTEQPRR